uniref:(northern house mosquito) hypothetical protein n=1 Tax=Culex pipiens TaxID=7175 RepID=A0A8D8HEF6_CULPI
MLQDRPANGCQGRRTLVDRLKQSSKHRDVSVKSAQRGAEPVATRPPTTSSSLAAPTRRRRFQRSHHHSVVATLQRPRPRRAASPASERTDRSCQSHGNRGHSNKA